MRNSNRGLEPEPLDGVDFFRAEAGRDNNNGISEIRMAGNQIQSLSNTRRLQLLIEAVVDYAIYLMDLDGRVLSWNSGARRLKGYEPGEIVGQSFTRFYTAEDRERGVPQRALKTAAAEGRYETEGWRVRKDGSRFWALVVIDAVYGDGGEIIGFAKVTRDLTERQIAQQSLLESERRYRRLIESVVDYAIFQLDPQGIVTSWNPGAQRIKGYNADEIIGRHFSTFYTEEDRAAGVPEQALQAAANRGKYEAEAWRVRKNGNKFFASILIDPIHDEAGELVGFAKVTRDITERLEAQEALKSAQEQLALSQKMEAIGQLSGGIAHDFNNLMMIVQGNLESAQRNLRKLEGDHFNLNRSVNNALRGAQRAAALTSRLLAFSRRQPLDPKPTDVNRFLTGAADFLQRSLGETIGIEVVGSAGLWQIDVDANHLESALVNLAINARDAMPKGGKVTIEASNVFLDEEYARGNPEVTVGQYVVICVADSGEGMPVEVMSRAFEPFFTTKEPGQGTGLGLSQVYGFVKQSNGHVKIYSEPGQGTTVKLYFPRLLSGAAEDEEEDHEPSPQGEQGETILLVEDDNDLRDYLAELLRDLKYHVLTAADAESALQIAQRERVRIDLLLTDIIMPGMNGRELAQKLQGLRRGLPVLFMTGYSRNAIMHHGRLDQNVDVLQKPVSQSDLAARVRAALDRRRESMP
jgi:PAS domain S-box-containing protein